MSKSLHFVYGQTEIEHLQKRDKRLGEAIERIGPIKRATEPDLFHALIRSIVGQQISTKAQATIWGRIQDRFQPCTPAALGAGDGNELQSCGMSMRKATYIQGIAQAVLDGKLDLEALPNMSDWDVCQQLTKLKGIGIWTAEMILIFSLQRPDILSYGDLGILRGMRMLYGHREITPDLFSKYKRRYSPFGTVASLYLWAIAGGELPGLKDPAAETKKRLPDP